LDSNWQDTWNHGFVVLDMVDNNGNLFILFHLNGGYLWLPTGIRSNLLSHMQTAHTILTSWLAPARVFPYINGICTVKWIGNQMRWCCCSWACCQARWGQEPQSLPFLDYVGKSFSSGHVWEWGSAIPTCSSCDWQVALSSFYFTRNYYSIQ